MASHYRTHNSTRGKGRTHVRVIKCPFKCCRAETPEHMYKLVLTSSYHVLPVQNLQLQRELDALRRRKEATERELEQINDGLKVEAMSLKLDLDAILRQLSSLIDRKLDLQLEIATYRKLLDSEENRYVTMALRKLGATS